MKCFKCATPLPDNSRFCSSCGADVSGSSSGERTVDADVDHQLENQLREAVGGDFVIERELGRGGMAAVFLGYDVHLERPVAIKVLPPELTYGTGSIERFRREAKTAATLDHPNIIPVYRVSTGGKLFWYVMKYLDGEALSAVIERDGALAVDVTTSILSQTAEALQYAHDHGVIHRDIKPANVVVDARGRVTVTDFGIAKALSAQSMTGSGAMIGTPYYMSPEQCTGKKVTAAADQYSLGVMAYQMLSGHVPFTGESVIDIVKQHCMDPVPPLTVLVPGVAPPVAAVVEQALSKAPDDRFPSVLHFSEAFRAAAGLPPLTKLPAVHAGPKRTSSTVQLSAAHSPFPFPVAPPQPQRPTPGPPAEAPVKRRNRMRIAVITVLVTVGVAGGGVGGYLWLQSHKPPAPGGQTGPGRAVAPGPAGQAPQLPVTAPTVPSETLSSGGPASAPPAPERPTPSRPATIAALTGVPRHATIRADGRPARGPDLALEPGVVHRLEVQSGYSVWHSGPLTLRAGERRQIAVVMPTSGGPAPPSGAQPAPAGGQQVPGGGQQAPAGGQRAPAPAPANPQQPAPAAAGAAEAMGTITVGSTPPSTLYLNGVRVGRTPARNVPVRAGAVTARFEVQDSTGTRCQVIPFTVEAGKPLNPGIVRLTSLGPC